MRHQAKGTPAALCTLTLREGRAMCKELPMTGPKQDAYKHHKTWRWTQVQSACEPQQLQTAIEISDTAVHLFISSIKLPLSFRKFVVHFAQR